MKTGKKIKRKILKDQSNGLCIAGFTVSLVTIFVFSFYCLSGFLGIVLSYLGRKRALQDGWRTGLGTAGIVLGIINVLVNGAALIADLFGQAPL